MYSIAVSDELWELVQADEEQKGYNRDSYAFALQKQHCKSLHRTSATLHGGFIVRLDPDSPFSSPQDLQNILGSVRPPDQFGEKGDGENITDSISFCKISAVARDHLLYWLAEHYLLHQPVIARLAKAEKSLDCISIAPFLGINTTLPQFRPSAQENTSSPLPQQDQYPVWHFLYERLAESSILQEPLALPEPPKYRTAEVSDAAKQRWSGRYNALVDGHGMAMGKAFQVNSQEQEEALQSLETDVYEVVRCMIEFKGDLVPTKVSGLCFWVCAPACLLD